MPKPYYETELGKLYHGDCLEIMPHLEPVDLVLTDPPYGINYTHGYEPNNPNESKFAGVTICGDDTAFNPKYILNNYKNVLLFGANYYCDKLPPSSGWIVWDKRCGRMQNDQSDAELAWTNFIKGVRVFHHEWNGYHRDSERHKSYHPTQKPVAIINWIFNFRWTPNGLTLDPYIGSGTTAIACERLNRRWIGIEIEKKYCEIAAKRIEKERRNIKNMIIKPWELNKKSKEESNKINEGFGFKK